MFQYNKLLQIVFLIFLLTILFLCCAVAHEKQHNKKYKLEQSQRSKTQKEEQDKFQNILENLSAKIGEAIKKEESNIKAFKDLGVEGLNEEQTNGLTMPGVGIGG